MAQPGTGWQGGWLLWSSTEELSLGSLLLAVVLGRLFFPLPFLVVVMLGKDVIKDGG